MVTLWFKGSAPSDSNSTTLVDLIFHTSRFTEPIYVDLLTGKVYALPKPDNGSSFKQIPLYDSPILIGEKSALPLDTK